MKFVGGSPEQTLATPQQMDRITLGENEAYQIPALDFRGTPTGIAHKEPGIGMVGAGLVKPPMACFRGAALAFAQELE